MLLIDFNSHTIRTRLKLLASNSAALWGTMTATKMLQHLIHIQQISNGKIKIAFANTMENLPKLRHILYKEIPFPREFKAPKQIEYLFETTTKIDLEAQKDMLANEIDFFDGYFSEPDKVEVNVVFGPLNRADWIWFHRKHISHHLAQFGLRNYT